MEIMQHATGFLKLINEIKPHIRELTTSQVKEKLENQENFIFIDVREDNEWATAQIPQAVHFGRGVIERDIEEKINDKNTQIILYCGGGFRSALAAYNLQKMGYTNVYSMDGGIREWLSNFKTLTKNPCIYAGIFLLFSKMFLHFLTSFLSLNAKSSSRSCKQTF